MTRSRRPAGLLVTAVTAITMVLASSGIAYGDIGVAGFSPHSADPGDTVLVGLQDCPLPAAEVRMALARMSADEGLIGADEAVEVEPEDAGQVGEYLVVVPELEPGLYGVLAACPKDGSLGFWGSEQYLRVRGTPDTATLAPAAPAGGRTEPWRLVPLLASAMLAVAAWSRRRTVGRGDARR